MPDLATPAAVSVALAAEPAVRACVAALEQRYGAHLEAVLLYGSFLRGKRDTVLDFYVLFDDYAALGHGPLAWANRLLPPNVYFLSCEADATRHVAKYATLTLAHFEHALEHDFNTYFWSRFAQPSALVMVRDAATADRLAGLTARAARRLLGRALPMLPPRFSIEQAWEAAFRLTYSCELRAEDQSRAREIVLQYQDSLHDSYARAAPALALREGGDGLWHNPSTAAAQRGARAAWALRRVQGKLLSCARLLKAAFTFTDALDYILWKIERHSGVRVEASARQRRHPLIFSWGLLWKVYRRGGFR